MLQAIGSFQDFLDYFKSRQFNDAVHSSGMARNTICYFVVTLKRLLSEDDWPIRSLERFLAHRDGRMNLVSFRVPGIRTLKDLRGTSFYRGFAKARDEIIRKIDTATLARSDTRFAARPTYTRRQNPPDGADAQEAPAAQAVRPPPPPQQQLVEWEERGKQRNGNPVIGRGFIISSLLSHWAREPDVSQRIASALFLIAQGAFAAGWTKEQLLNSFYTSIQGTLSILY